MSGDEDQKSSGIGGADFLGQGKAVHGFLKINIQEVQPRIPGLWQRGQKLLGSGIRSGKGDVPLSF